MSYGDFLLWAIATLNLDGEISAESLHVLISLFILCALIVKGWFFPKTIETWLRVPWDTPQGFGDGGNHPAWVDWLVWVGGILFFVGISLVGISVVSVLVLGGVFLLTAISWSILKFILIVSGVVIGTAVIMVRRTKKEMFVKALSK